MFDVFELEGMMLELQWCHSDVHFWFKPKDRPLDDGFELKSDKDLLAMFEDMRKKKYRKVEVYVDESGKFGVDAPATPELDASGEMKNIQKAQQMRHDTCSPYCLFN